jgi:hypothetical protein
VAQAANASITLDPIGSPQLSTSITLNSVSALLSAPWRWVTITEIPALRLRDPFAALTEAIVTRKLINRGGLYFRARLIKEGNQLILERTVLTPILDADAAKVGLFYNRLGYRFSSRSLSLVRFVGKFGVADFVVGGLFQLGDDLYNNPELVHHPGLLVRRSLAGGATNLTAGAIGGGFALFVGATFELSFWPVAIVAVGATVVTDIFFGEPIGTFWFQLLDATGDLPRNLAPLGQGGGN